MARIRTIKPDTLQHRKIGRLSDRAFRLWVLCLTQADDEGRLLYDAEQFCLLAFGYNRKVQVEHIEDAIQEILDAGLLRRYQAQGETYLDFPSWRDHQVINRKQDSKLPGYNDSLNIHGSFTDDSLNIHGGREGKGEERKGKERKGKEEALAASASKKPTQPATDEDFIAALRSNSAYQHINIDDELAKMDAWLMTPKGRKRQKTRGFIVNWLNKIDRPMSATGPPGEPPSKMSKMREGIRNLEALNAQFASMDSQRSNEGTGRNVVALIGEDSGG